MHEAPTGSVGASEARELRSTGDLAGLEAAGAHVEALRGAVDLGTDALDVGVEATLRDLARPRPVVAEARLLGADVADGSHEVLLKRIEWVLTDRGPAYGQPSQSI